MSGRDVDALRGEVAEAAGLPPAAAGLLQGATLAELEDSASQLAQVVHANDVAEDEHDAPPLADLFADRAGQKLRRQRALVMALHGPRPQPRDEAGRFAAAGFDGGARRSLPPPPQSHDAWLAELLVSRRADRGAHF